MDLPADLHDRTLYMIMKRLLPLLALVLVLAACDGFVDDVGDPIDSISDEQLINASQTQFLINGVLDMFAETLDDATVLAEGLSDAFLFDRDVPNATFPTFEQVDQGDILLDNNSVDGLATSLGEYRLLADTLLTRIARIDELSEDEGGFGADDADLREQALFEGNFHGGVARYFYAAYFGLTENEGGGTINRSPFMPSAELYAAAVAKLDAALPYADAYETKAINTLKARIALFQGQHQQALSLAQQGLMEGDAPYSALYSVQDQNAWYSSAGRGRTQYVADDRFADDDDPRSPVEPLAGSSGATYYRQAIYPDQDSPIPFLTWQENALIIAEALLQTGGGAANALAQVNAVRADAGLDALDALSLDVLIVERDQTLFGQGLRLIDQRRFGQWHLGSDAWRFLPITARERNDNPNL